MNNSPPKEKDVFDLAIERALERTTFEAAVERLIQEHPDNNSEVALLPKMLR